MVVIQDAVVILGYDRAGASRAHRAARCRGRTVCGVLACALDILGIPCIQHRAWKACSSCMGAQFETSDEYTSGVSSKCSTFCTTCTHGQRLDTGHMIGTELYEKDPILSFIFHGIHSDNHCM